MVWIEYLQKRGQLAHISGSSQSQFYPSESLSLSHHILFHRQSLSVPVRVVPSLLAQVRWRNHMFVSQNLIPLTNVSISLSSIYQFQNAKQRNKYNLCVFFPALGRGQIRWKNSLHLKILVICDAQGQTSSWTNANLVISITIVPFIHVKDK